MSAMIEVAGLSKRFGAIQAVDGISLEVHKGEVLGFLGPNGAGKSTTMKMITGFLEPDSGTARVCGFDIGRDPIEAKKRFGYMPEGAPSYQEMTPLGFLGFIAGVRGFSGQEADAHVRKAAGRTQLESVMYQPIDTLSRGYKRRVGLAAALLHDPDVLVLDEPTDGLDPNQKHEVRNLIRELGTRKAVIFSTHILEEVDAACTRAIIIDRGRIVANGTPAELRAMSGLAGAVTLKAQGADVARLAGLPAAGNVESLEDGALRVYPRDKDAAASLARQVIDLVASQDWKLEQLRSEEGQLDEVFRRITLPDTVREAVR